jgi:hypothetical protein
VAGTSATYTVNVTNGVWLDPPNWWTYQANDIIFLAFPYGVPTFTAAMCSNADLTCTRIYNQVNQGCYCTVINPQIFYTMSATGLSAAIAATG